MNRCYPGPARARSAAFAALAAALAALAVPVRAETDLEGAYARPEEWRLAVSPYTLHWRPNPEHKRVWAIAVERQRGDNLLGASFFSNSFGQDSSYWYYGERYTGFWGEPKLFAQWSVGLLYGYRGQYEDKVPLNHNGYSPGALIGLGWNFDRGSSAQFHLLGDAGVMLQLNYAFR